MKLDRLLAIVVLLMNKRMVQAKELADLFEVSVRTIYRDVDAIDQAGIPIVTYQGAGGGIGIEDGYRLDRNLLTNDEYAAIATALRSVATTYDGHRNHMLLEKINSIISPARMEEFRNKSHHVLVDYSPWGMSEPLEARLEEFRIAIEKQCLASFAYSSSQGEVTSRCVEPHTLLMKGRQWYLYAYCKTREEFRLFKLMRMKELIIQEATFTRRPLTIGAQPWDQEWSQAEHVISLTLRFNAGIRHLVEEQFGAEVMKENVPGKLDVTVAYPEDRWLYGFLLSFGDNVEVLHPPHLREMIRGQAVAITRIYESSDGNMT